MDTTGRSERRWTRIVRIPLPIAIIQLLVLGAGARIVAAWFNDKQPAEAICLTVAFVSLVYAAAVIWTTFYGMLKADEARIESENSSRDTR